MHMGGMTSTDASHSEMEGTLERGMSMKALFFLQSDMNSSQHFLESLKLSSAFISCKGSPTAITSELALVIAVLKANGLAKLFNGLRGFPVSQHMSSTVHINSTEMFLHKKGNATVLGSGRR